MTVFNKLASRRTVLAYGSAGLAAGIVAPALLRPARAQTMLRLAVADPQDSSVGRAATRFAELVSKGTDGDVSIQVFPDGVLFGGDQNAAVNQLGSGALDGLILASSVYASFEPKMNAVSLPYLFSDYDQLKAYLSGEPGQELMSSMERLRIVGLGAFLRTFRNVTTRETPITTADDFSGLKLRTPNNQLFVRLFEQLGASPTPMAFSEVYNALQLQVIDGQENPVEVPFHNRFYEVQNHLNMTRHLADSYIVGLSQPAFDKIDETHQDAVRQAAATMIEEHDAEEIAQEDQIIGNLREAGMQVNEFADGELQRVQEIARGIYPEFAELIGSEFMDASVNFVKQA